MTRWTLLFRTLLFHWRTNLAVCLGVVAGTAVIGGALIVGDSVRGSLRDMTVARLGPIDFALTGPRFFREDLAADVLASAKPHLSAAAGVILLEASLEKHSADETQVLTRAGRANLVGMGPASQAFIGAEPPGDGEVNLNSRLARELEVKPGDRVTIVVELPSDIPRDALLGKRDDTSIQIPLTVRSVLAEDTHAARFGLRPNQQMPLNAIMSLKNLQDRLGLAGRDATGRDPRSIPPRVNTILATAAQHESNGTDLAKSLDASLREVMTLADVHGRIVPNEKFQYLSLESDRMILDRPIVEAGTKSARQLGCQISPVLAYIANEIRVVERTNEVAAANPVPRYSRYSVVAGIDPALFAPDAGPPFGPFRFEAPETPRRLGSNGEPSAIGDIIINEWLAKDLAANVGDVVRLTYHVVGSHGELPEEERRFTVRESCRFLMTPSPPIGDWYRIRSTVSPMSKPSMNGMPPSP